MPNIFMLALPRWLGLPVFLAAPAAEVAATLPPSPGLAPTCPPPHPITGPRLHPCPAAMIPPGHVPGSRAAVPPGEKSHKERLLAGEPYDACDPELVDDRIACRKLLHQFNTALAYDDVEGRAQVLKQLLGSYDPGGPRVLLACRHPHTVQRRTSGTLPVGIAQYAHHHAHIADSPPFIEPPFFCDFG